MENIKNRKILVDSSILIYCGSIDHNNGEFKKLLRSLTDNQNKLAISEFCGFEVVKNCQNKDNVIYYLKLLDYIDNIGVNISIYIMAAKLYNLYNSKKDKNEKGKKNERMVGDLIIGATAISHKALLLTTNISDFPRPFWRIVDQNYIIHKYESKFNLINVFLLEFDENKYKLINEKLVQK